MKQAKDDAMSLTWMEMSQVVSAATLTAMKK